MENEDNLSYNYILVNKNTVGSPYPGFCICRFNWPRIKNIWKKIQKISQSKSSVCCMQPTIYRAFTLYLQLQTDLILLHFPDITCFTNWRFVATLHQASPYRCHFSKSIFSLRVSVSYFGNPLNCSSFFITTGPCWCRRCRRHGVHSLGREDSLEKEMATHSSVFAWRIPRTEEPGGL